MKALEQNPDFDVMEYGCLGNCGQCYMEPYALVNGEIIAAESADALHERILNRIKEIEAMYELLGNSTRSGVSTSRVHRF